MSNVLTDSIMDALKTRGLKLCLYEPRDLRIIGPRDKAGEVTTALRESVASNADELIEVLALKPVPMPEVFADKPQALLHPDGSTEWLWDGVSRWYTDAEVNLAREIWFGSADRTAGARVGSAANSP